VAAGTGYAIWSLLRERSWEQADPASLFEPWGFALLLWLAPGMTIALSAKYQREILLGSTYLPGFFACFGVALGLALALGRVLELVRRRSRARWMSVSIAVTAGVCALFTYAGNRRAVAHLNREWRFPREVLENALARGLGGDVPPGAWLGISSSAPMAQWHSLAFFRQRGAGLDAVGAIERTPRCSVVPRGELERGAAYYLAYEADSPEGFALLARLEMCTGSVFSAGARSPLRIFRAIPAFSARDQSIRYFERVNPRRALEVSYRRAGVELGLVRRSSADRDSGLRLLDAGDDWQLWELADPAGVDLSSLRISMPAPPNAS
jgi:hypothetical protein